MIDASGDPSELASRTTLARFAQAGVIPTSTNAVLSETHRTWNRPEAAELAKLYGARRAELRGGRALTGDRERALRLTASGFNVSDRLITYVHLKGKARCATPHHFYCWLC